MKSILRDQSFISCEGGGRPFYWMFIFKYLIFRGLFSDEKAFNIWGSFNKFHESIKKAVKGA